MIFNPKKSFRAYRIFSAKEGFREVGNYTPTTDAVKLDVPLKDVKQGIENMVKYLSFALDDFGKIVLAHEIAGHAFLTKTSSFWFVIYTRNIYTSLTFDLLVYYLKEFLKYRSLEKNLSGIIIGDKLICEMCEMWRPLHESLANFELLLIKRLSNEKKIKDMCQTLVEGNTHDKEVKTITENIEYIMETFDIKNGYEILKTLAIMASSPKIELLYPIPSSKSSRTFQDAAEIDPNTRFKRFLEITIKLEEELKILAEKEMFKEIFISIISASGHTMEPIEETIKKYNQFIHSAMFDSNLEGWKRLFYKSINEYMKPIELIAKNYTPTFWFVRQPDKNFLLGMREIVEKYPILEEYMFTDVMKNEFLNSFKLGENRITCFGKKLSICQKGCSPCKFHPYVEKVTEFTDYIIKNYSYEDIIAMGKEYLDNYFRNM